MQIDIAFPYFDILEQIKCNAGRQRREHLAGASRRQSKYQYKYNFEYYLQPSRKSDPAQAQVERGGDSPAAAAGRSEQRQQWYE